MKKLPVLLFVASIICALAGCRKPVEVSISMQSTTIAAEGGTYTADLKSNGEWAVSSTAEWLTVSPASGNGNTTLTLLAQANPTDQVRSVEIQASTKDNTALLTLTQEAGSHGEDPGDNPGDNPGNDPGDNPGDDPGDNPGGGDEPVHYLTIQPEEFFVVYEGGSMTITLGCDETWSVINDFDWVSFDKTTGEGDDEVIVTVAENATYEPRRGEVKFISASDLSVILTIAQDPAPNPHFLDVTPLLLEFGNEGGDLNVTINCDADWQIVFDEDWLTVSTENGTGMGEVTFTAEPNAIDVERSTNVRVISGALSFTINVMQAAGEVNYYANVTPDSLFVGQYGGVRTIDIVSNCTWTILVPSWITMLETSGEGDATLDMMVGNNMSSPRTGTITILHGLEVLATVTVVQEGVVSILETDVDEINVTAEGGIFYFNITANQDWQIINPEIWLDFIPFAGSGDMEVMVKVGPLDEGDSREVTAVIKGDLGVSTTITIRQSR